jgi:TPR repeat protein
LKKHGHAPLLRIFSALLLCAVSVVPALADDDSTALEIQQATEQYLELARQGDAEAQFMLFYAYQFGMGVEPDTGEAMKWLQQSAENGFPDAVIELGLAHLYGKLASSNASEGVAMLEGVAGAGYVRADVLLGSYYLGVDRDLAPRDPGKAKDHLLAAAEAGSTDAFYLLGLMYRSGLEPEAGPADDLNIEQAVYWYKLAAKQGHLYAMAGLGEMYIMPLFGINDFEQGFFLAKSAQLAGMPNVDPLIQEALLRIDLATQERLTRDAEALVESFQSPAEMPETF